jgi:fucose 4-O-acetylase-like acetyltransferase
MYGVDWLRAAAAVLVVMLHASIPYLTHPLPGLIWSTESTEHSAGVNLLAWWIDGFIMPVFFLMSGFFAAKVFHQRGADAFLKHRLSRLGLPFLFAFVFILPLDLYAWLLGWVNAGLIPISKLKSLKVQGSLGEALWGVSHLWFLEYMLVYCLAAWGISRVNRVNPFRKQVLRYWSAVPVGMTWMAAAMGIAVAAAVLWKQPRIVIGFRHHWLPCWENLIYYAVPFLLGWTWQRVERPGERLGWGMGFRLAAASAVFMVLWPRLLAHVEQEFVPAADPLVPILFATFGVLMATSLFGLAQSLKIASVPAGVAYLSKASFWIYLLHHPLVGLAHDDLALVNWPPVVEFGLTVVLVLAICVMSFEVLVRRTWIGILLHGYREQPLTGAMRQPPILEEDRSRRAA